MGGCVWDGNGVGGDPERDEEKWGVRDDAYQCYAGSDGK